MSSDIIIVEANKKNVHKNYILIWKGNYCSPLHFYRICNTTSLPIALLSVNEGKTEASKKRSTVNVHINFKQILNMECTKVERSNKKKSEERTRKEWMNEWMSWKDINIKILPFLLLLSPFSVVNTIPLVLFIEQMSFTFHLEYTRIVCSTCVCVCVCDVSAYQLLTIH